MRHRRRIFRSATGRRSPGIGTMSALVVGVCGTAAVVATSLPTDLFGRSSPPAPSVAGEPGSVAVIDGDTLRMAGQIVRLRGVQAPARGDECGATTDCGGAATLVLADLVRGRRVECAVEGADRLGRPFAACVANGTDLSHALVASGWARAQPNAPELAVAESSARQDRRGLWAASALR